MIFRGKSCSSLSDSEIIDSYKSTGNPKAPEEFFFRYSHLVYGVCYKYLHNPEESKDAVMEIFDLLPRLIKKHEIKNFRSWLYSVTKNYCLMKLRKEEKTIFVPLPENEEDESSFMEFPGFLHLMDKAGEEDKINLLLKCLEQLDDGQKTCIKLFFMENKSYKEINQATGYDFKQVKSFIQNGKRNLRLKLEQYKVDEF